jgi:hypothetical protein
MEIRSRRSLLRKGDKLLVTANKHGTIVTFNVDDGTRNRDDKLEKAKDPNSRPNWGTWQIVVTADICPRTELLAVARRGRPPEIWSVQDDVMITTCHLAGDKPDVRITPVSHVLFNPNRDIELLAVASQDGQLAIFDT